MSFVYFYLASSTLLLFLCFYLLGLVERLEAGGSDQSFDFESMLPCVFYWLRGSLRRIYMIFFVYSFPRPVVTPVYMQTTRLGFFSLFRGVREGT